MAALRFSSTSILLVACLSSVAMLLSGCGAGPAATSVSTASSLRGIVHGGPNPVAGATVSLYEVSNATPLATAVTGSDGTFQFSAVSTCTDSYPEYVVVTGGDPGSGTNPNYMLMAALGSCGNISSNSVIWVDEVSTVAAGYALSNFITITGSAVSIAGSNSDSGHCVFIVQLMVCDAAGVTHAFQNAFHLSSTLGTADSPPTGQAYATAASNPTVIYPTQLINSIANSIETCVNSTGGSASDPSTPCGRLFSYTTPPDTGSTTSAPTNTLQAVINMAKYPTLGSTANVANLINMPTGFNTYYQPALTAPPHDLSLALAYKGVNVGGTTTAFGYPYYLSLDANDAVYTTTQAGVSTAPVVVTAMNSNGDGLWVSGTLNGTTACQDDVPCMSAPDSSGTLWVVNGTTTAGNLFPVSVYTGNIGAPYTVADTAFAGVSVSYDDEVFVSVPTANAPVSVYSLQYGSPLSPAVSGTASVPFFLSFDGSGNLWMANKYTSGTTSVVTEEDTSNTSTFVVSGEQTQTVDNNAANGGMYGLVVNFSGTAYGNNANTFFTIPGGNGSSTSTAITDGSLSASSARYSALDGNNNVFIPDNGGNYTWEYFPPGGAYTGGFMAMLPCLNTSPSATTCGSGATGSVQGPRNAAIDSTGSIWITSSDNGNIVQIIGTAAPTFPLLEAQYFHGQEP